MIYLIEEYMENFTFVICWSTRVYLPSTSVERRTRFRWVGVVRVYISPLIVSNLYSWMFYYITLVNNFLLSECCLDFYKWIRVFWHCWIRKWHPFLSIRSGFCAKLIWKNQILWQNQLHFCGIINRFLSTHIILNMFLRKKKCFANNIYWLHDRNIDYCHLNGGHW